MHLALKLLQCNAKDSVGQEDPNSSKKTIDENGDEPKEGAKNSADDSKQTKSKASDSLIIRHDLTHDQIHHFKPLSYRRMKEKTSTENCDTSQNTCTETTEKRDHFETRSSATQNANMNSPEKQGSAIQNRCDEWYVTICFFTAAACFYNCCKMS